MELTYLIIQSVGVAQSVIWALFLLTTKRLNRPQSHLIGILFTLFGIRVVKSMIYLHSNLAAEWIFNIGFAAHLFIGPVLIFYIHQVLFQKRLPKALIHLVPGLGILLLSYFITLDGFWYRGGYTTLLIQSVMYLLICIYWLAKAFPAIEKQLALWLILLLAGFSIVLGSYFANYLLGIVAYNLAPTLFAAIIFVLSFYLFQHQESILTNKNGTKYRNLNLDADTLEEYKIKIIEHYRKKSSYLNPDCSLSTLSREVNIPKHILSSVFNQSLNVSFIDYTNRSRIEIAKRMIAETPHLTIAAIAQDSGFNSISSFNKAFKKFAGSTPSAYREGLHV